MSHRGSASGGSAHVRWVLLILAELAVTTGCAPESDGSRGGPLHRGEGRTHAVCCPSRDLGELPPELAGLTWPTLPTIISEIDVHTDAELEDALDRSANLRIRVHGSHPDTYILRRSDVELVLDEDAWIGALLIARSQHRIRITGGALGSIEMLPPVDYPNGGTTVEEDLMISDVTIECVTLDAADTALVVRGPRVAILGVDVTAARYSLFAGVVTPLQIEDLIVANSVMRSSGPEGTFRIHDVVRSVVVSSTFSNPAKHNWRVHGVSRLNHFRENLLLGAGVMIGNEPRDQLDRQWFANNTFHYSTTSGLFVVPASTVANLTVTDNVVHGDGPLTFPWLRPDWTVLRNTFLPYVSGPSPTLSCPAGSDPDAGPDPDVDGGVDAGNDAGTDAPIDAGFDASEDAGFDADQDAGMDAGLEPGEDASIDAGMDAGLDPSEDASIGLDARADSDAAPPGDDGGVPLCCASRDLGTLPPELAGLRWPELPSVTSELDVHSNSELFAALASASNARVRVHGAHPGAYVAARSDLDIVLDADASIEALYIGRSQRRIRIAGGTLGAIEMPPTADYSSGSPTPDAGLMATDLTIECVTMSSPDTALVVRGSRVAILGADITAVRYALYAGTPPVGIEDLIVAHSVLRSSGAQATVLATDTTRSVIVSTTLANPSRYNWHVHGASSFHYIGQSTLVGPAAVLGNEPGDHLDRLWFVGNAVHSAAPTAPLVLSAPTLSNLTITDNVAYGATPLAPPSSGADWTIARNTTLPYTSPPSSAFECR